jgi:hypothetical protein
MDFSTESIQPKVVVAYNFVFVIPVVEYFFVIVELLETLPSPKFHDNLITPPPDLIFDESE